MTAPENGPDPVKVIRGLLFKDIWPFLRLSLIAQIVTLLALMIPLVLMAIIDRALLGVTTASIVVLASILAALYLAQSIIALTQRAARLQIEQRVLFRFGQSMWQRVLGAKLEKTRNIDTGQIIERSGEGQRIFNGVFGFYSTLINNIPYIVIATVIIVAISAPLAAIIIASIPFIFGVNYLLGNPLRQSLRHQFDMNAAYSASAIDLTRNRELISVNDCSRPLMSRLKSHLQDNINALFRSSGWGALMAESSNTIRNGTSVLFLAFGAIFVVQGEISVGQLFALNLLSTELSQRVLSIVGLWEVRQNTQVASNRLQMIYNVDQDASDAPPPTEPILGSGPASPDTNTPEIEISDISYSIGPSSQVLLNQASLSVLPGDKLALFGPSGSGKSTLARLLTGQVHVPNNAVRIGGRCINSYSGQQLKRLLSIAPQDSPVIRGTIAENITMARQFEFHEDAFRRALNAAGLFDYLAERGRDIEYLVEEGGRNLSGGERGRLSIARLLYHPAPVKIFDECSAGLSRDTTTAIVNSIKELYANVTCIFITHDWAVGRLSDRIVHLQDGSLLEQGEPEIQPFESINYAE